MSSLKLGLERLLFRQIKCVISTEDGKENGGFYFTKYILEKKKQQFALGCSLNVISRLLVQIPIIIKIYIFKNQNWKVSGNHHTCPRTSCCLSRDERQAAVLWSNALLRRENGKRVYVSLFYALFFFIKSTEDDKNRTREKRRGTECIWRNRTP